MARRKHTLEFKRSTVQLVNQQGYSVSEAAKSLAAYGQEDALGYGRPIRG